MPDVMPEKIMNSVLGKITDILVSGDGVTVPVSEDHYLSFMNPGIPISKKSFNYAIEGFGGKLRPKVDIDKLDESIGPENIDPTTISASIANDALEKYTSAESFSAICDLIPDTSRIIDGNSLNSWNPEGRVSHSYAMALRFSQVYDVQPSPDIKEKIEYWRSLLEYTPMVADILAGPGAPKIPGNPSPTDLVKAYREKSLAYQVAIIEFNNLRIAALSGTDQKAVHEYAINGAAHKMKVQLAEMDWVSSGYKGEYELITSAIKSVEGKSFTLLKSSYIDDFTNSLLLNPSSGASFPYTRPMIPDFANSNSGWTKFTFDSGSFNSNFDFNKHSSSIGGIVTNFGIGTGIPIGGLGNGKFERETWNKTIDREHFSLEFEMVRVPIYRPWLNLSFLKSGFWRFDQNNQVMKNTLLSDGKNPPSGLLPAITTDCIIVRNLKLNFGTNHQEFVDTKNTIGAGGGISYGPLFLGGSHDQDWGDKDFDHDWDKQTIEVNGMQIIGFVCHSLDKSPNPNPGITTNAWI